MGCADCCAKAIIIIINIFFFLLGLAFLAVSVVYFAAASILEDAVNSILPSVAQNVTGGQDPANIVDIFQPIFIALLVIGIFMLIASILAMCGSCCSVSCMLITYVIFVSVVFLAHLVLFICLMVGAFGSVIKDSLKDSLDDYVGITGFGANDLLWNSLMSTLECCGVDSYRDFNASASWNRQPQKDTRNDSLVTPVNCCYNASGLGDNYECAYKPTDENNNLKDGCWEVIQEELVEPNQNIVIGINCGILGFELILMALTICVIIQARKEKL